MNLQNSGASCRENMPPRSIVARMSGATSGDGRSRLSQELMRATATAQIKTPPGIGRRLDSKCRGRWKRTYTGTMKVSILVAGVEAIDLAQQGRPDQLGRAQFGAVGIGEHSGVLVDHGLFDRVGGRA